MIGADFIPWSRVNKVKGRLLRTIPILRWCLKNAADSCDLSRVERAVTRSPVNGKEHRSSPLDYQHRHQNHSREPRDNYDSAR